MPADDEATPAESDSITKTNSVPSSVILSAQPEEEPPSTPVSTYSLQEVVLHEQVYTPN